ncbi:MAG: PD-(D/E)XK nuclease family protein, partial [Gammaproteobacteria bacterium]|nr:PD-(D/E)XK nuclease family protein [Gammaproteobacteria bacterium]
RDSLVQEAAQIVLDEAARANPRFFPAAFRELEQQRLMSLVKAWLEQELKRAPFEIDGTEQQTEIAVGPLRLRARVDRIDKLNDGRRVLIDYKTGRPKVAGWFEERPEEPQLPLYAIAQTEFPAAILFAQVNADEQRYLGIAENNDAVAGKETFTAWRWEKGVTQSWQDLANDWRKVLDALADEFATGKAAVDPKDAHACRYCHLSVLCRIDELSCSQRGFEMSEDE